jgi:hypothetical protein
MAKAHKKRTRKPPTLLLFVDTNIWLDFYRTRSEVSLKLLGHLESAAVSDHLIGTYQLEMEYKKNRRDAIREGMNALKVAAAPRLGVLSDAAAYKTAERALTIAAERVSKLKKQLSRILETPTKHDPVYQAFQRLFHNRESPLVLKGEGSGWRQMSARALRRFLTGCPPRKGNETSIGDAINWEWMVECAKSRNAGLVIVSRDGDYGMDFEQRSYLNEHLLNEFRERVNKQGIVILCRKLSDALKYFHVTVTAAEEEEEREVAETEAKAVTGAGALIAQAQEAYQRHLLEEAERRGLTDQTFIAQLRDLQRMDAVRRFLNLPTTELAGAAALKQIFAGGPVPAAAPATAQPDEAGPPDEHPDSEPA